MALVIVILVLLTLSALGTTMILNSQGDHLISANERDAERALLASRSGLNYAYYLFEQGLLTPTSGGTAFTATATGADAPLDGSSFSGTMFDLSAAMGQGQLYRIRSVGTHNRANRTTELTFQIVPEAFKYGYMAFNRAQLDNHSKVAGSSFSIQSTVFSNNEVEFAEGISCDGSIVAAGPVEIPVNTTIRGDIFANSLANDGTIEGDVKMLTAVEELDDDASMWDRIDNFGTKHAWYNGATSPGAIGGSGTITGSTDSYAIVDGDEFRFQIFRKDGSLMSDPDVNVAKYVPPPKLDYQAMKAAADEGDATYFTSMAAAMTYVASKKVTETIDGKTVTTVKIGTSTAPEFLYITDAFEIDLTGAGGAEDISNGQIAADGFHLEGGMYASGDITFDEAPAYTPSLHPSPPVWHQVKLNGLAYCYPALISYPEPATGTIDTWTPDDTPAMTGAATKIKIQSNPNSVDEFGDDHEGFHFINGVTYSEGETHIHHTKAATELIRFNGAELAFKVHNCDFFDFTYDPAVRCTRFLVAEEGDSEVVSFREVR